MALTWRRVKGADLTPGECDANTDEIQGLLTRTGGFTLSQTPGANQAPVLDASGRLPLGSDIAIRPAVAGFGPVFGARDKNQTLLGAAQAAYLTCNCYYDGTNWRSIASGAAYALAATQNSGGGAVIYSATATAPDQIITFTAQQLMSVPAASSWQVPTLLNSWEDFQLGYSPIAYLKDGLGIVRIRGALCKGTNQAMFNLPAGYRPAYHKAFIAPKYLAATGWGNCSIVIMSSGDVQCNVYMGSGLTTSDSIHFGEINFYAGT